MEGFGAGQVVRLTGVKYATLDHWVTSQFLTPSITSATGSGVERRYSFQDVVALRVARELRDAGISLQALRKVVARLRENEQAEHPLAEERLIVIGDDVVLVKSTDELLSVLRRPGQLYVTALINLRNVVDELRAKIAA